MKPGKLFGSCLALMFFVSAAFAHDPGLSSTAVVLGNEHIEATLIFSGVDAAILAQTGTPGEIKPDARQAAAKLKNLAAAAMELRLDGREIHLVSADSAFDDANNVSLKLVFQRSSATTLSFQSKWLAQLPPGHREYAVLKDEAGKVLRESLLSSANDTLSGEFATATVAAAPKTNSFLDFLAMGVKHIWTGYDHLLFLFGLMIVTRNFKASIKIITCFTIAHSITLAIATLNVVQISSRIVEPLIAASIIYVGLENLWRKGEPRGRWLLTFMFGLIHGFGFASVLRELGVGTNGSSIAIPLISFNLGVELGQIAIAAAVLPLIWQLRTRPVFVHRWVPASSVMVALLGTFWFVQRVWF